MGLKDKAQQKYGDPEDYKDKDFSDSFNTNLDLPVKPGAYLVEIQKDNTEERETKSGGEMLNLEVKILGPEQKNRHIFDRFIYDCPKNRDFEKQQLDQILHIASCCDVEPTPEKLWGQKFIAETGLEYNDGKDQDGNQQWEESYDAVIWGARPASDGPASGAYDDDEQPAIWQDAVELAKGGDGGDGTDDEGDAEPTKTFTDDDVGF
jgi:hypothetical protein